MEVESKATVDEVLKLKGKVLAVVATYLMKGRQKEK